MSRGILIQVPEGVNEFEFLYREKPDMVVCSDCGHKMKWLWNKPLPRICPKCGEGG